MSTVNGDDEDDDRFKIDDKESFTLGEESTASDVHVLPLILPLQASILFFSGPKR
jgi:hypothetical protein